MRIITNENKPGQIKNWIESCILQEAKNASVNIAVAFFSNTQSKLLEKMIENDCYVRMIVRLNYGTSPDDLLKALDLRNTQIRFFTSSHFHPKMYIIGDQKAYIGSSNFTDAGMHRNQEINVEINSEDYDFEELNGIFEEYWSQAKVLDKNSVLKFKEIVNKHPEIRLDASVNLKDSIGIVEYNNVGKEKPKSNDWKYYSDQFKRVYQEFLTAYNTLETIYTEHGKRRFSKEFPIRIEIDRFLWWVRQYKATGDSYSGVPRITNENQLRSRICPLIDEFVEDKIKGFDEWAESDYYNIQEGLASKNIIESLHCDDLFAVLTNVHAFYDRLRYYEGGQKTQKEAFFKDNSLERIKKTIIHLIYDTGDYIARIYDCINNPEYKLKHFGEACVTELYGVMNNDGIPLRNGRTEKSMEWLGFGKI